MRLIDNSNEDKVLVPGDYLLDDNGDYWYVVGYSSYNWVELIEMSVLAEHVKKFRPSTFDLTIEH